ncbi:hypothetical protein GCM10010389_04740 [Streptomyces echinoruber]|uniref:M23ase beta-sheet core domain-containing protein n=1 Tax=Streptomyces echinoruber TaxID=68898 RepID=A0A918QUN1_9ACTN|nr:hypothetical protein GCM10010389_04740 [Streptomyces echinoruber]
MAASLPRGCARCSKWTSTKERWAGCGSPAGPTRCGRRSSASTHVEQGRQIGTTGSTGNSTGPHIHYEQLYNGVGQDIRINGGALACPGSSHQYFLTSDNGCGGAGVPFTTWGSGVRVRSDAYLSAPVVTPLSGPTSVRVLCQKQGDTVNAEGYTNNWWSKLRDQNGFISNIYIDNPAAQLPGVPVC